MSICTVVFDFGNVLAYFSHRKAAEQLAAFAPAGVSLAAWGMLTFSPLPAGGPSG